MQDIDWSGLPRHASLLGVDVGSLYLKAVAMDSRGEMVWHLLRPHQGNPLPLLDELHGKCRQLDMQMGVTGSFKGAFCRAPLDSVLCLHAAARHVYPSTANILEVGAAHFCLVSLNRSGDIQSIRTNPLCAAGTGSFLDAQAERMGLDITDPGLETATDDPPSIATRCAVFAKSDLIHRQQEGFDIPSLWSGLCRGLAEGLLHTLTHGNDMHGEILLCGGVALNQTFVGWLRSLFNGNGSQSSVILPPHPEFTAALGAGLLSRNGSGVPKPVHPSPEAVRPAARRRRPALTLKKSHPPRVLPLNFEVDHLQNEITIHRLPSEPEKKTPVFMGLDIGSTSTKLALVDASGNLLVDMYRRTQSNPIEATRHLFRAALALQDGVHWRPIVAGVGTTGSGRKLIGEIIGADLIINEISAHVAGAVRMEPDVETIFEIGGQDAKYMRIHNGRIVDANLNYVCAAGTGSFVEELSSKLGYGIEELGEEVLGTAPPYINSRCTVFMEQDILALLREGVSRREAAGAIIYSVIENYLHRVVGKRPVNGERIVFQGATARNIALTAAIEHLLDCEVVVSPYPHAMGAYGVALLVQSEVESGGRSRFKGLDLASRRIEIEKETCHACLNRCELTRAVIEGEENHQLWGMKCGRDESRKTSRRLPAYEVFQARCDQVGRRGRPAEGRSLRTGRRIVMPLGLSAYSLGPFWSEFFSRVGVELAPGPPTDEAIVQAGRKVSGSEFCLPVIAALGHIAQCLERNDSDPLFVPHLIGDYHVEGVTSTRFCPYLEILPSLIQPMVEKKGDAGRIISPVIDFRLSDKMNARALVKSLRPLVSLRERDVVNALQYAHRLRRQLGDEIEAPGRVRLAGIRKEGRPAIVVIGRPYNTLDLHLSHNLPYEIAAAGLEVLPLEALPFRPELLGGYFSNVFWAYGQRILSALIQISQTEGLYPVYLSNFGCGPDSFMLSYAESIMGEKPMLIMELDEHGSSGGYLTRLEAFLEVVKADCKTDRGTDRQASNLWQPPKEAPVPENIRDRCLCIPHMHSATPRILAAAFRGEGFQALALPMEDEASFAEGRKWARGSECLPAPLTLGSLLKLNSEYREKGIDPNATLAFFMPTSDGPCRFGQYCTLDRMALDRVGCRDLPIVGPSPAFYGMDERALEIVLLSDILFKLRCKMKPGERTRGDAEATFEKVLKEAERRIENRSFELRSFIPEAVQAFARIPVSSTRRLLVGVVGEIYVRSHAYANNRLVETIEELGGEAWVAPVTEWIMYCAWVERYRQRRRGMSFLDAARFALKWRYIERKEHEAYRLAAPLLADRTEPSLDETLAKGWRYLPPDFEGESILTLGRAVLFQRNGVDLIINCFPFGCMHGNITSALFNHTVDEFGVPIVNIAYDGMGDANSVVETFMKAARQKVQPTFDISL